MEMTGVIAEVHNCMKTHDCVSIRSRISGSKPQADMQGCNPYHMRFAGTCPENSFLLIPMKLVEHTL